MEEAVGSTCNFSTASHQLCFSLKQKYNDVIKFNPIKQFFPVAMLPKNITAVQPPKIIVQRST